MAGFKKEFDEKVRPALREKLEIANKMAVPTIEKIVINMGIGNNVRQRYVCRCMWKNWQLLTRPAPPDPQSPKKSISNFRLREGMQIGARVTLRGARMYDFLERFINTALPRIRDFRGIPTRGFDGRGNYTLGIREQTIFPEIDPDKVKRNQGMDITIVTTAETDEAGLELLRLTGMPFADKRN